MTRLFDPDGHLIDRAALKSVRFGAVVHESYDPSTGTLISDHRQQRVALDRKQDEMSERMGYDVTYGQADPTDRDTLGITPDE